METQGPLLLIDDDTAFCSVLQRALIRRGWEVLVAHAPEQALMFADAHQPTHVILDLNLEGRSGLALIAPLQEAAPACAILLLTGYASIPTAVEAIKLGALNYLTKPVDVEAILAAFGSAPAPVKDSDATPMSLRRLQWEHVQRVLQENEGNISAAARQLGLHRRTLQRQLRKRPVKQ